jgi:hypothetical protein
MSTFAHLRTDRPLAWSLVSLLVLLTLIPASGLASPVDVTPIAIETGAAPGGNGTFGGYLSFGDPCINDSGQIGFYASLVGTAGGGSDNDLLARGQPGGPLVVIAREGNAIPGGGGFYGALQVIIRQYTMNNSGRMAYAAMLTGTPGGSSDNQAIYTCAGPGTENLIARRGSAAPFVPGMSYNGLYPPVINNQVPADVAYYASLGTGSLPATIYIVQGTTPSLVSWLGQPAPDGNGSVSKFFDADPPALRQNQARVAFLAHLTGTAGGSVTDDGIFTAQPAIGGGFTQVARGGQPAPLGGLYQEFYAPTFDILGNAAFRSDLNPPPMGGFAIYTAGAPPADRVVRSGDALPDHSGFFHDFYEPSLSAGNVTAFKANLNGTPGGGNDDSGIYRGDGFLLYQVAREDQPVPEGNGRFANFGNVVGINAQAQVLFTADLRGTSGGSSDNRGLYLWTELDQLCKLLRKGDTIGGRTVLGFSTLTERDYGGFRSLNDSSQVAVKIDLSGFGGDGIYLVRCAGATAAVPTPVAVAPVGLTFDLGPNPFRESLGVRFAIPGAASGPPVAIIVYDVAGRPVRRLGATIDGAAAGLMTGRAAWDGRTDDGRDAGSGVYFLRLTVPGVSATREAVRLAQ